jgi:hypothetical protein
MHEGFPLGCAIEFIMSSHAKTERMYAKTNARTSVVYGPRSLEGIILVFVLCELDLWQLAHIRAKS